MFSESCKNSVKSLNVLFKGVGIHNDVIQLHEQYLKYVVIQTGLHKPLEGRRTIGQSHGHSVILEDSKRCCEGSLVSVFIIHGNLIKSTCEIHR